MSENISQAVVGLNLNSTAHQLKVGELTFALNAQVGNFDGNEVTYQNEQGSDFCITPPEGYKIIGAKNFVEISKVVYFLANPTTGYSQIVLHV